MNARRSIARCLTAAIAAMGLLTLGSVAGPTGATAAPRTGVETPAADVVATGPAPITQRGPSTVTADALPTVQLDSGVAWAQVMVGNTVYVGGSFSNARPANAAVGTNLTPRANLLAYDVTTGDLVSSWAPSVNGTVKSLAKSPDGRRIYVGGSFTQANGQTRWNFAAFDAITGQLVAGFSSAVGGSYIQSIVTVDNVVYVGGLLGAGNGVARKNLMAFNTNGQLLGWAPTTDLQVDTMVRAPGTNKLIVGGRFGQVNGQPQRGLVALDLTDGTIQPWAAPNTVVDGTSVGPQRGQAGIWSLTSDANAVYGTGWVFADKATGNLEGAFSAEPNSGAIRWIADCHGDHYGIYSDGTNIYSTSHEHACETMGGYPQKDPAPGNMRNATAMTAAAKGTLLRSQNVNNIYADWSGWPAPAAINWYPDWYTGTATGQGQAGWTVTGNGQYVVVGGEFPGVNQRGQYGLVRFASNPDGGAKQAPRLSGDAWVPVVSSVREGVVNLSITSNWDRDDLNLTYQVTRVGTAKPVAATEAKSSFWNQPTLSFSDKGLTAGQTYSYLVKATDGDGNSAVSKTVSVTVSAASFSNYASAVIDDGASLYWRLPGGVGSVTDYAGSTPGVARTGVTQTSPGAIVGDPDPASSVDGTVDGLISGSRPSPVSPSFSVEMWFKTTTNRGGKLVGYGSAAVSSSSSYDRHIYMSNDGRLTFGTYAGSTQTITSPSQYNDGTWHHVVATQAPTGMQMYVDGVSVGSNPASMAQDYTGYWRVGGDNLNGWPLQPTSQWFSGSVDEFAVYPTALSAASVKTHFDLGSGAQPPSAAFTTTVNDLSVGVDGSTSTVSPGRTLVSYAWDFGDSTPSIAGATANHVYAKPGSYTVTLGVTDNTGLVGTTTKTVVIKAPHTAPVAVVSQSVNGLTVKLDGTGSEASDGATINSYDWSFGDGETSTLAKPTHAYTQPGSYVVKLSVKDSAGATSSIATVTVTVTHADPAASFTASAQALSVSVDASASAASDAASLTYSWNWGDGTANGSGKAATHEYASEGNKTIVLTITDSFGAQAQTSRNVSLTAQVVIAQDNFSRSVVSGWGTADVGGAWTGIADASVSNGTGLISIAKSQTRTMSLASVNAQDSVSRFSVSLDKVPDGGGVHVNYMVHKSSAGGYRLKLRYGATGVVNVGLAKVVGDTETLVANKALPGFTQLAGSTLQVRLETSSTSGSTTVRARVWVDGQAEPATWFLSATQAEPSLQAGGSVGFSFYGSGSMTNGPTVIKLDDLDVR